MITSYPTSHNRLLDLDQTLLGWKHSAIQAEDPWEEYEDSEYENHYIDETIALDAESIDSSDSFSYQDIADRLESRKSLGYGSIHQRLRSAAVEEDVEPEDALIPEAIPFSWPEIELPDADFADSMFADSEDFSGEGFPILNSGTSYSALFQSIHAARQGDLAGVEDEGLTIAETKPTIDIEAQIIN
jgi:hypothetical protein